MLDRTVEFWLQYWIVFAIFSLLENLIYYILVWIPFYYPVKLCLLLWLCCPQTCGATYAYTWIISPMIHHRKVFIDNAIGATAREAKNAIGATAREAQNSLGSAAVLQGALNAGAVVGKLGQALLEEQQPGDASLTRPQKRRKTEKT
jgi:hypothetical protein